MKARLLIALTTIFYLTPITVFGSEPELIDWRGTLSAGAACVGCWSPTRGEPLSIDIDRPTDSPKSGRIGDDHGEAFYRVTAIPGSAGVFLDGFYLTPHDATGFTPGASALSRGTYFIRGPEGEARAHQFNLAPDGVLSFFAATRDDFDYVGVKVSLSVSVAGTSWGCAFENSTDKADGGCAAPFPNPERTVTADGEYLFGRTTRDDTSVSILRTPPIALANNIPHEVVFGITVQLDVNPLLAGGFATLQGDVSQTLGFARGVPVIPDLPEGWTFEGPGVVNNMYVQAAVPEPTTYALMLAGLGLVGYAAGRRRPAREL